MSAPAIIPLGIKPPTTPTRPIVIRRCTDDCCAVQVFSKRFILVQFPDKVEPVTSFSMAIASADAYITKLKKQRQP